jgi:hypothetical protein
VTVACFASVGSQFGAALFARGAVMLLVMITLSPTLYGSVRNGEMSRGTVLLNGGEKSRRGSCWWPTVMLAGVFLDGGELSRRRSSCLMSSTCSRSMRISSVRLRSSSPDMYGRIKGEIRRCLL